MQSLINKGDGNTVYLTPVEQDKSGSMIAELFVYTGNKNAVFLNSQMVSRGYAWHDKGNSDNCPSHRGLVIAEKVAKDKKLGGAEVVVSDRYHGSLDRSRSASRSEIAKLILRLR